MATSKKQQAAIAMSMKAAGKKPKMAMGGTPKFDRKEQSDNMMKPTVGRVPLTDVRMAKVPAPNPKPSVPKAKMGGMIKKTSKKK
jgi:hypothetical protein